MNNLEYFDKSIDEQKSRADKKLLGTEWYCSRYINRVGYKYEPLQMESHNVLKKAMELVEKTVSYYIYSQTDIGREKADLVAEKVVAGMLNEGFPFPLYKARGELCDELNKKDKNEKWRRIWFIDHKEEWPHQPERKVKLLGIKNTWTGKYYPASGDDESYYPGGLSPSFHQSIYEAQVYVFTERGTWMPDRVAYIYPLDLKEQPTQKVEVADYEW